MSPHARSPRARQAPEGSCRSAWRFHAKRTEFAILRCCRCGLEFPEQLDVGQADVVVELQDFVLAVPPDFRRAPLLLTFDDPAVDFDLEALLGVPPLSGGLAPLAEPAADG